MLIKDFTQKGTTCIQLSIVYCIAGNGQNSSEQQIHYTNRNSRPNLTPATGFINKKRLRARTEDSLVTTQFSPPILRANSIN